MWHSGLYNRLIGCMVESRDLPFLLQKLVGRYKVVLHYWLEYEKGQGQGHVHVKRHFQLTTGLQSVIES